MRTPFVNYLKHAQIKALRQARKHDKNCRVTMAVRASIQILVPGVYLECRLLRCLLLAEIICHGVIMLLSKGFGPLIFADVDGINVTLEEAPHEEHARIDSHALCFVDASDHDAVTRLCHVHKVVMCKQGSLSGVSLPQERRPA
jgi:hypothetical protein